MATRIQTLLLLTLLGLHFKIVGADPIVDTSGDPAPDRIEFTKSGISSPGPSPSEPSLDSHPSEIDQPSDIDLTPQLEPGPNPGLELEKEPEPTFTGTAPPRPEEAPEVEIQLKSPRQGKGWVLHLNALTYHFQDGSDNNETNWGLGLQREFHQSQSQKYLWKNWRSSWEIDVYNDSYYDIGVAGGVLSQRPLLDFIDFGLKLGLVYEEGLEEKNGSPLLPYLLPFLETSFDTMLNARVTVVPPISDGITGIVTLQLIVAF